MTCFKLGYWRIVDKQIKEIKQQKYFCNITPAKPQQTHRENEDAEDL